MKRYSTTDLNDGRNSLGIFETLSFIQEGASRHDLETLKARTTWQYNGLRAFLESVAGHAPEVLKMVQDHRARLLERAASPAGSDPVHMRMAFAPRSRPARAPPEAVRKGERGEPAGRPASSGSTRRPGRPSRRPTSCPRRKPSGAKVVDQVVKHWFPQRRIDPGRDPAARLCRPPATGWTSSKRSWPWASRWAPSIRAASSTPRSTRSRTSSGQARLSRAGEDRGRQDGGPETPVQKGDFYISCVQPAANLAPLPPRAPVGVRPHPLLEVQARARSGAASSPFSGRPPSRRSRDALQALALREGCNRILGRPNKIGKFPSLRPTT